MNKFRILLSLLVAAGASFFALRHHTLRSAQTANEQLQQQLEQATNAPVQPPPAPVPLATNVSTHSGLSAAERSELLRLRGQVGPLRRELAQTTNELAKASRPRSAVSGSPEEPIITREEVIQKMNRGKQWMLALILYADQYQQRFPDSLAQAASFAGQVEGEDDFEFVKAGLDFKSIKSPSTTIVLREKRPWRTASQRWGRVYCFADGHIETANSDTPDFTEWEEKHRPPEDQAANQ